MPRFNINEELKNNLALDFSDEACDLKIFTSDDTLSLPLNFLESISDVMEIPVEEQGKGKKKIKTLSLNDITMDELVKALTFYKPKHFKDIDNSCNFEDQLKVAQSLYLEDYKKYIENYLIHQYPQSNSSKNLTEKDFSVILLADQFHLNDLKDAFMAKEPRLMNPFETSFENKLMLTDSFRTADKHLRYEILKNTITSHADVKWNKLHKGLELEVIFNFMDFLFYEHKVQDNSIPSRKRSWEMSNTTTTPNKSKQTPNMFLTRNLKSDVCLIVDGVKLFISPFILKENSIVFKRMLESTFKEGREQCIKLPDKGLEDIVQFLNFLKFPQDVKDGENIDLFALSSLCREYQVDWLGNKIRMYLNGVTLANNANGKKKTRLFLRYIGLSQDMGWKDAMRNLAKQLVEPYVRIQTYKEFSLLALETKLMLCRVRITKLLDNIDENFAQILVEDEKTGLYGVLSEAILLLGTKRVINVKEEHQSQ